MHPLILTLSSDTVTQLLAEASYQDSEHTYKHVLGQKLFVPFNCFASPQPPDPLSCDQSSSPERACDLHSSRTQLRGVQPVEDIMWCGMWRSEERGRLLGRRSGTHVYTLASELINRRCGPPMRACFRSAFRRNGVFPRLPHPLSSTSSRTIVCHAREIPRNIPPAPANMPWQVRNEGSQVAEGVMTGSRRTSEGSEDTLGTRRGGGGLCHPPSVNRSGSATLDLVLLSVSGSAAERQQPEPRKEWH